MGGAGDEAERSDAEESAPWAAPVTRFVLASASPGRLRVLRNAGVDPVVVVSGVDEDAVTATLPEDADPQTVTGALAEAKARRATELLDSADGADCVVVGCDSMLDIDGELHGKPASVAEARARWRAMSGRSGRLHTGHSLIRLRDNVIVEQITDNVATTVRFGTPSAADLEAYLDSGEPLRVAGSFTLDGLGGWFVDGVDGDPSSVVGISLPLVRRLVAAAGLSISQLWSHDSTG